MNVVVLNTVLSNTGDAAIFQAIVESLEQGETEESVDVWAVDSAATTTRTLYPQWKILQQPTRSEASNRLVRALSSRFASALVALLTKSPSSRRTFEKVFPATNLSAAIRILSDADLVLSSGGTYLVDHYDFEHKVREIQLARSLGKPIHLWTQSLGPFKAPKARKSARKLAHSIDAIHFRDERSQDAWDRLQAPGLERSVSPDTVFSLKAPPPRSEGVREGRPIALLSVREWAQAVNGGDFDFNRYAAGLRALAIGLVERGFRCIALSTCQGVHGYNIDDSQTAAGIFRDLPVEINDDFHTPDQLLVEISKADLVVSTRMHMAILALISKKPVLAIAYETKTSELFSSLGGSASVTAIESVDEAWAEEILGASNIAERGLQLNDAELERLRVAALRPAVVALGWSGK